MNYIKSFHKTYYGFFILFVIFPLSAVGISAYIGNSLGSISVIDVSSRLEIAAIPLDAPGLFSIAVTEDGSRVYIASVNRTKLFQIDGVSNTLLATTTIPFSPRGMAVNRNGTKVYIGSVSADVVTVVDTTSGLSVVAAIPIAGSPNSVAVAPSGDKVYVGSVGEIVEIDAATNTVSDSIPLGINPKNSSVPISASGLAISPSGGLLYVAGINADAVIVIDLSTKNVIDVIPVVNNPFDLALSSDGSRLYASNFGSPLDTEPEKNSISVIDTSTGTVITTIPVGIRPLGISLTPDDAELYVANNFDSTVSVIDTGSNTVVATIPLIGGFLPTSFGQFIMPPAPLNRLPVADAEEDQILECISFDGALVSLNGSGSSDPDGDPLVFAWTNSFGSVAGEAIDVTLPLGSHLVTLTVDDGISGEDLDTVEITVQDTIPPSLALTSTTTTIITPSSFVVADPLVLSGALASDICDTAPSLSDDGPDFYPLGETEVTISSSDASGNIAELPFTIIVERLIEVNIDIKPGSDPNSINLKSKGSVPVVILGSEDFDAGQVDPATITLAGASVTVKKNGSLQASIEDINEDGFSDLLVHVNTSELLLSAADLEAVLEGETFSGDLITGIDSVKIIFK